MGGLYKKKKSQAKNKQFHRSRKTKHYFKDTDQIYQDIQPQNKEKLEHQPIQEDLPGLGQFYCVSCARYFNSQNTLQEHQRTKVHKKALNRLKEKPYDHKEAEECGKY